MAGMPTAPPPRAPADAPVWAIRMLQTVVTWVETIRRGPQVLTVYTVSTLPNAAAARGGMIAVSDETGGFTVAFSDGADWRRTSDRAVVS